MTYRLYDYGRLENGKSRELHIDKALDVINYTSENPSPRNFKSNNEAELILYECDKYSVYQLNVNGEESYNFNKPFLNCTVIEGRGQIDSFEIESGDNFIVPFEYGEFKLNGKMKLICSHV